MFKKNRKKRKLKYIREKNSYRLNKYPIICFFKVSKEMTNNEYIKDEVLYCLQSVEKKFNIKSNVTSVEKGQCQDDFLHELETYKVYIRRFIFEQKHN